MTKKRKKAEGIAPPPAIQHSSTSLSQIASVQTALILEPETRDAQLADELVQTLGFRTTVVDEAERALAMLGGHAPPDLVLVGLPGAEEVARAAAALGADRPTVVVAFSGRSLEAHRRCDVLGADLFVLRPYRRETLAPILRAAQLLRTTRRQAALLAADLEMERARPLRLGEVDPQTGFQKFDFFKMLLLLELKRAKRYGYSLAACLVALDRRPPAPVVAGERDEIHDTVARALHAVIRDIDMPVDYADGKFLIFLPYTDLSGAERVGRRLEAAARTCEVFDENGHPVQASVSIGIAASKPGRQVSFAKLIRDASSALRAAQLKGGGRVVVRA